MGVSGVKRHAETTTGSILLLFCAGMKFFSVAVYWVEGETLVLAVILGIIFVFSSYFIFQTRLSIMGVMGSALALIAGLVLTAYYLMPPATIEFWLLIDGIIPLIAGILGFIGKRPHAPKKTKVP